MRDYILEKGQAEEYSDLLTMIEAHLKPAMAEEEGIRVKRGKDKMRRRKQRAVYGVALTELPLAHGPVNEFGVVFLFGSLARELGFVVLRIRAEYPDIEAMREIGEDQWQHTWIEVEYESRNFLRHRHDAKQCEVVVCWIHNWPGCPLEVIELREVLKKKMERRDRGQMGGALHHREDS
jgi:hypothetical protein